MKDVDLKNLKTTGVHTHSNLDKVTKEKKPIIPKDKKTFVLGGRKEMIMTGNKSEGRDNFQQMKVYLSNFFKVSKIHVYAVNEHPFKAKLVMGEPLDNEALIMSYCAFSQTEVFMSALGVQSSEIKSRMITQMHIESVDFRNYIGNNFLIIFDSMILEAFKNKKDARLLMEYTHKCLTGKLKTGRS